MATIRPPWICKEDFYHLPFNYCDRRCEKCNLTSICKVFIEGEEDRKRAIAEGKDPDSWEFTFEVLHKNLEQTFRLLYEGANKWGIDLEKIEKESKEEDFNKPSPYENNPLYKLVIKFSLQILRFIENFAFYPEETKIRQTKEDMETLSFYRTTILAKTARALSSEEREENYPENLKTYDDKTSFFIVYNCLDEISKSLLNLSQKEIPTEIKKKCLHLSKASFELSDLISDKFKLLSEHPQVSSTNRS